MHIPDVLEDPEYDLDIVKAAGLRGVLSMPMLLPDGEVIGAISVSRATPGPFAQSQIDLLRTFADQAVIAIENVRPFRELEARNRDLTEALEQQTATSEILRTIAHAPTDVQPVFDTIVQSAARLCRAANAAVFLTDGRLLYHPANYGSSAEGLAWARARYPPLLDRDTVAGMAILARSVVHTPDIKEVSAGELVRQIGRLLGFRGVVVVPMLREGEAVGALLVGAPGARQILGRQWS